MKSTITSFLFLIIFSTSLFAQPPWALNPDCNSINTTGIALMSCGITTYVPAGEQYSIAMADLNGALPTTNIRENVTTQQAKYTHPDWDVTQIVNIYGLAIDDCGNAYACATSNYGADFFGQTAVLQYGAIGGGADDLNAAGTIYKLDSLDGSPSVWAVLPQQAASFSHTSCEGGTVFTRNSGPALGNIAFDKTNQQFFVSNFEDGRIYRLNKNGDILDSYDPNIVDDGMPGVSILEELVYGIEVAPDGSTLYFGTVGTAFNLPKIYSVPLTANGGFIGLVNNSTNIAGSTWDNYINSLISLNWEVPQNPSIFTDVFSVADLKITPTGDLLVGVRMSCDQSIATSYNHGGTTYVLTNASGVYDTEDGEIITSGPYSLAERDCYGGVAYFENPNGGLEYVLSSGDILGEYGPHGIVTQPDGVYSNTLPYYPYISAASPAGVISYGTVDSGDPKGVGGDVEVFEICSCNQPPPIVCADEVEIGVETAICAGDLIDFSAYTIESFDTTFNVGITVFKDGNVITSPIAATNNTCAPTQCELVAEYICVDDSSIVLYDTVVVTIYPVEPGLYVNTTQTDCEITASIVSGCEPFITLSDDNIVFNPGDAGTIDITATYSTALVCDDDVFTFNYNCPACMIDNVSANVLNCNGQEFSVELNVTGGLNPTDLVNVNSADGSYSGTFAYNDFPVVVGPFAGDETTIYTLNIVDALDGNCSESVSFGPIDCQPCSIDQVVLTAEECNGIEYDVTIDLVTTFPNNNVEVTDNQGNNYGIFAYSDFPITIGSFIGDNVATYEFTITDVDESFCSNSASIGPVGCYVCDMANISIDGVCNGVDVATFDVYISFEGSNEYSVTDHNGNVLLSGITSGQNIFVGAFPNSEEVTITVSDDFVDDCDLSAEINCIICDPSQCISQPGTIMTDAQNLCPGELTIADADDFLLMPKQSVFYVIHSQPTVTLSDLPDYNTEVYAVGSFFIHDGTTVPCGETVYFTAFGAMEDHNIAGFPDYNDICMTVSNTIPVNLLCPVTITTDENCDTESGEFTFTFQISGGLPEFVPGEDYDVTGNYFTGNVDLDEIISVGPITDGETYSISATDGNGCAGTFENNIQCEKLPVELLSFTGNAKADNNHLVWEVAAQINNDFFTLEKSIDGSNFKVVTTIKGAGTVSDFMTYTFNDFEIENGLVYYKLSQTDFDGSKAELGVVVLNRNANTTLEVQIAPNPFKDQLNINVSNIESVNSVNIYDLTGKLIFSESEISQNNISISEAGNWSAGVYFLEIISDEETLLEKIIRE